MSFLVLQGLSEPFKPFHNTISSQGTSRLHMPCLSRLMKSQCLHNLDWLYSRHINLIGQNQNRTIFQLLSIYHTLKCVLGHLKPISVTCIQNINDGLRIVIVVMPEISQFGLSSDVPDCELEAFVVDFLHIKADGRNWVNVLFEFHLVEDCGFSGVVQP